jgi:hypothetical protein
MMRCDRQGGLTRSIQSMLPRGVRAWHARPEAHGAESSAWQRAILRFFGTAREDGP